MERLGVCGGEMPLRQRIREMRKRRRCPWKLVGRLLIRCQAARRG
jgi:hypothetical protein